ncbi:MAG: response regulator [Lachnospiraceae bacterium]|nr:response regulator [Lachnospiraceae bacterium]
MDDEPIIRNGIKQSIDWSKADISQVYTAGSGTEALQIMEREDIAVLITDIRMDDMSGIDLIEQVREKNQEIRIILMTAYDEFEYAQKGLRLKVDDFLVKPVEEDQLLELVIGFAREKRECENHENLSRLMQRVVGSHESKRLNRLMRHLIYRTEPVEDTVARIQDIYNYREEQNMQAVVFYPRAEMPGDSEEEYLVYALQDFCTNNIDLCEQGITFLDNQERIVIAFFCEDRKKTEKSTEISEFLNLLNSEFHIAQKVAVGSVIKGFSELAISYHEALLLMENVSPAYVEDILEDAGTKIKTRLFWDVFGEVRNRVLNDAGDDQAVYRAFETFSRMMDSYDLSLLYVRRCSFDFALAAYYGWVINHRGRQAKNIQEYTEAISTADKQEVLEITRSFLENLYNIQEADVHEVVENAKKYIQEHLAEKLSVSSLAQMHYVTPAYFSRLFKKAEGMGCNEYIGRMRMDKASYLLRETGLKTGDIALKTGYDDKNYFSITFKKFTGLSPTSYRAKYRNESES